MRYYCLLCMICYLSASAQVEKSMTDNHKSSNFFAAGGGLALSSVNIFRNYRENPYRLGYNARVQYHTSASFRWTSEYTYTPVFNINPTWLNVTNQVIDIHCNAIARIVDYKASFYTISGFFVQRWKGFYTGINDFSGSKNSYTDSTTITNNYLGLGLGIGFEKSISEFILFGEFRYRFTDSDNGFGITDAAYTLGIKKEFSFSRPQKRKHYKGKYDWF